MKDPAKQAQTNQYVVFAMSAVLLFGAFTAVTVTATEYSPSSMVWLDLGLDLLLTILLPVLLVQIMNHAPPGGLKTAALLIGAVGVLAGLVKLGARFSGDAGWWTGHYNYAL